MKPPRDLVRAREDARADPMRARHRLSKLLLRYGRARLHRRWVHLEQRGLRRTTIAVAVARELAGWCWASP